MPVRIMWNLFCEIHLLKSRVAIFLIQNSISDRMPLAWEATLSAKERKAFKVIYGVARAQEEIYEIMAELLLCHGIDGTTMYCPALHNFFMFWSSRRLVRCLIFTSSKKKFAYTIDKKKVNR